MISANLLAVFYLISGVLFILALRGLSSPETSRQGNLFGILGMVIAVTVTFLSTGNFSSAFIFVLIFISFVAFVSFFPQLVAGPIERASNLLPQILKKREFHYEQSVQGLRLILWGMFKKVVIADSLAPMVDDIFSNYQDFGGGTLWLGAIYFAFQIYCDFSGYSDIAIGTSMLFGFELMSNFNFPLFYSVYYYL